jgi:hypothetical protein
MKQAELGAEVSEAKLQAVEFIICDNAFDSQGSSYETFCFLTCMRLSFTSPVLLNSCPKQPLYGLGELLLLLQMNLWT